MAGRRAVVGSLYSATKWAITGMGESLRQELNDTGVRVTVIEPGMTDTPFFDNPLEIEPLQADDIARAVLFAVQQPPHMDVNEILIRPTAQPALGQARPSQVDDHLHVVGAPLERVLPLRRAGRAAVISPRSQSRSAAPCPPPPRRSGGGWR